MRRLLAIIALGLALPVLVVLGMGADGDSGSGYEVRAIFDNVASAVPGEDVKVAGAKIGVIKSMDVTKDKKAAVVLQIEDARFTPFHADAKCTIRPQSLIGEKFVECNPGTAASPALARIGDGDQHLLPLKQTSSPVDLDLINNINRRPYRERLSILLNEFGTGLAGRGKDLNEVIHRANPALRETDKVLAILAKQNQVLGRLAVNSDRALAPLAREKRQLTGFIESAGDTATATAERREDIARGIERFPGFLRELQPLMADLQGFAEQATPVATNLNRSGRDVSRVFQALGPFSQGAQPSLETLGDALRTGRPAVLRTRPLVQDVGRFAKQARPLSSDLDKLTASIDKTDGIERLMETIYFTTLVINGFDEDGYYQRANLLNNLCSTYQVSTQDGCSARFEGGASASAASAGTPPKPANAPAPGKEPTASTGATSSAPVLEGLLGSGVGKKGREAAEGVRRRAGAPGAKAKPDEAALDYLLGGER
ncbi:MAG TPA: MlaD family protein [Thermoleophilaceae bacterium]|nr:MlaD family protein [Thermoleophilaceae bacterium]